METTPTENEPVVTEPVVTDPVVTEPVTDPVVTEPAVTEPVVTDPVVTDPVVTEPVTDPVVTEPVSNPLIITIHDILLDRQILLQNESQIRSLLMSTIVNVSLNDLKTKLIQWASMNFPPLYSIVSVDLIQPNICSDGVTRNLTNFIEFCLDMSIESIVNIYKDKMPDLNVAYVLNGNTFGIAVTKV